LQHIFQAAQEKVGKLF